MYHYSVAESANDDFNALLNHPIEKYESNGMYSENSFEKFSIFHRSSKSMKLKECFDTIANKGGSKESRQHRFDLMLLVLCASKFSNEILPLGMHTPWKKYYLPNGNIQ